MRDRHFGTGNRFKYLEGGEPNEDPGSEENECNQKPDDAPNCGRSGTMVIEVSRTTNLGTGSIRRFERTQTRPNCSLCAQWYRLY